MTLEEFINTNIKSNLGVMVATPELKYLSFIVMSSSIEFLGACIDQNNPDFHPPRFVPGLSSSRFNNAINAIPAFGKYRRFVGRSSTIDLYSELRCGLSHSALPKPNIELTELRDPVAGSMHLQVQHLKTRPNPRLILVCEDLYNDISLAATEVIAELKNPGKYHHNATDPFMLTDIEI